MLRLTILILTMLSFNSVAGLIVTTSSSGSDFTNAISGSGITIDSGSVNYIGSDTQGGLFSGGVSAGIGIESGILLTSGNATGAVGPNTNTGFSGNIGSAGDADLSALIGGTSTNDANILEFEFTTDTGNLFFNFVFGSEEYNEYLSYIDPFGLLVNGVNYALAPDGQAISVGTVNCGSTGAGTGPNCSYFNNNVGGIFDIEYDGFTDVFTASISNLAIGQTHTMKFGISDATDNALDSAVFIEAGSFSSTDPAISVPEPSSMLLLILGLLSLCLLRVHRY
ncbi:hypothetical protein HMF8227_00210 [Saliniradius amylolyticus]|uniref:Ice-binding protein C-terminal domain-containing protein n=1 Tax=Saliniradius amylolyticus TaxID=2183582 RepID=A0A2S2DZ85_9ALTE|nr:choice-of-anchor L domain-containing protein [Saliniradius amylolyticus]AWL10718.1 hypothetical protein HMF8227_00210 [Saliniradius amylolyticus]